MSGLDREVAEEVNIFTQHSDKVIALINDDSNDVGKVHLGIVHRWELDEPNVTSAEDKISNLSFMDISQLENRKSEMETWSAICFDYLSGLMSVR